MRSAETFRDAVRDSPFTFNVGYADDRTSPCTRRAGCRSATRASIRACPTKGTGEYEWRASSPPRSTRSQINPPTGVLVNWNNRPAPGWGAADDNWSYGSAQRVRMLDAGIAKRRRTTSPR